MKILITCPPMLKSIDEFIPLFEQKGIELICPEIIQTLTEEELIELVPQVEGWIIGDDPATANVFSAGKKGKLRAAVKWGVGVDNVDFKAAKELDIPISNTPAMFGEEVSDIALAYVLALARHTHQIDRSVRNGVWLKRPGISLTGRKAAVIGFGNIGKATARKLKAFGLDVSVFDPYAKLTSEENENYIFGTLNAVVSKAHFLIITCALTATNRHLINDTVLMMTSPGSYLVNVSRGPLLDEAALIKAMEKNHIAGAGLDVFEIEPLHASNPLRKFDNVIFGSHNGSNTIDAVRRASLRAIEILFTYLKC